LGKEAFVCFRLASNESQRRFLATEMRHWLGSYVLPPGAAALLKAVSQHSLYFPAARKLHVTGYIYLVCCAVEEIFLVFTCY